MNHTSCAAVLLVACTFNSIAHSQLGSKEEAIRAAHQNVDPPYIADFMNDFSETLRRFSRIGRIERPEQRLALLGTVGILLRLAHRDAMEAAQDAAAEAAGAFDPAGAHRMARAAGADAGLGAAETTMRGAVRAAWPSRGRRAPRTPRGSRAEQLELRQLRDQADEARFAAREEAQREALAAAEDALRQDATLEEVGRVAYRVAERVILERLLAQIELRLPEIYNAELARIPQRIEPNNPFVDINAWTAFRAMHFDHVAAAPLVFISPLVDILDAWTNFPGAFAFLLGRLRTDNLVHLLPRDVAVLILGMVAPNLFFPLRWAQRK